MFIVLSILIVLEILIVFWFIALELQKFQKPDYLKVDKNGKIELRNYDDFVIFTGDISGLVDVGICGVGSKISFQDDSLSTDVYMGDIMVNLKELKKFDWKDANCTPEYCGGKYIVYSFKCLSLKKGFKPVLEKILKFASGNDLKVSDNYLIFTYGKGLLKNHELLVKVN